MLISDEVMLVFVLETFVIVATEVFTGSEISAMACIYALRHPKTVALDNKPSDDVVFTLIARPISENDPHPVRFKVDVELVVFSGSRGSQCRSWNEPLLSGKELFRETSNLHSEAFSSWTLRMFQVKAAAEPSLEAALVELDIFHV
jgi:hypothetical protein